MVGLLAALDRPFVNAVVGHDYGASVAAWCAVAAPGPVPRGHNDERAVRRSARPYQRRLPVISIVRWQRSTVRASITSGTYGTREANEDMMTCPQGLHSFLRGYYHHKSADWSGNHPVPLAGWTATELARMPTYYIMDLHQNMAQTVAREMPSPDAIGACTWLPDHELRVYSSDYARTGFQGGLQSYRCRTQGVGLAELQVFSGRTIDVPSLFIAGQSDWGIYQNPGAIERMQASVCTDMRGCHLVDRAGHWVQQENQAAVLSLLLPFLQA